MAIADIFGQYVDKRLQGIEDRYNQASGLLSGDSDAWAAQFGLETEEEKRKRREREQQQQDLANVVVTSTKVDTYGDGSQTETVKREIPAAVAPEDIAPAAEPAPMLQTREEPMQAQVQTAPAALAQAAPAPQAQPQRQPGQPGQIVYNQPAAQAPAAPAPAMAAPAAAPQAQPMAQTQAMPAAPVQAVAPAPAPAPAMAPPAAAPAAPIAPGAQAPAMPQLPQPGPPVQVASTMPGAGVAEAAAAAQAAQAAPEPAWMAAANEAGNDFDRLMEVAAKFPEARASLKEKMKTALDNQRKEQEAEKLVLDAAKGDLKAQNKVNQMLRPEKGRAKEEITTGDYVKAYLYARLGLNELASEAQRKIMGKTTKFGQMTLGKSNWQVETDSSGNIVGARDNEGIAATESTLNKLRAEGRVVSTATPPSAVATRVRDSQGTEWSQVPTPQGMQFYDNSGKQGEPVGRTVPIAVGSDLEIAQAKEDMQTVAAFSRMNAQARLNAYENTNKRRADRGMPQLTLEEMGLNADGSLIGEATRRSGAPAATTTTTPPAATTTTPPAATTTTPPAATTTTPPARTATTTPASSAGPVPPTPLVSTQGPVARSGSGGGTPTGQIPTAYQMEQAGKEGDLERSIREAQIKDRNKSNQDFSDELAKSRQSAAAQGSTINRLQSSIDRNPEFWGIDTNSTAWRAYVDINSTDERKADALNTLARNLNIPKAKRAQFDQTMNDYRNLQLNAITGSGLTASQANSEKESQRIVGTVGSISDRPAAAKATLEYAKAKIEYTDAKARAWAEARRTNPGIDRLAFEANFDATTGDKIFRDANDRINRILGQQPGGFTEGQTSKSKSGRPIIYRNGRWEYQ